LPTRVDNLFCLLGVAIGEQLHRPFEIATAPILLIVNYRLEYRHDWTSKSYYRQLYIDPLPPESVVELLEMLLGADTSVQPLKEILIDRTEGNPLFIEESVRTLVESRVLIREGGAYRLARAVEATQVPATVQAILMTRIDRLHPELKRLLQIASVIGNDVPFVILEAIADMRSDELQRALLELQAGEFLYEARQFPDLEYTFNHALTHDVAYGSLLEERRCEIHATVVAAIERLHADRMSELIDLLAHHALRGRLGTKAVFYLRQAGEKAVARSADRAAVRLFEMALELLAEMPNTAETLSETLNVRIALGPALAAVHGPTHENVLAAYKAAFELVERLEDVTRRFPVLWGLWYVGYNRGEYQTAHARAQDLLAAAHAGEDAGRLLEAHHALWATLSAMGEPAAAVPHTQRGIALYDRDRDATQMFVYGGHDSGVCCRHTLGLNRWLLGYPDQALQAMRDALRLSDELQHPMTSVRNCRAALLARQCPRLQGLYPGGGRDASRICEASSRCGGAQRYWAPIVSFHQQALATHLLRLPLRRALPRCRLSGRRVASPGQNR
jgi:tetratricopeptide (TPR) repeat protein